MAQSQPTKLLIRGGTIVTPEAMFVADLLLGDGVVLALGSDLASAGTFSASGDVEVVDAEGLLVLPGIVDAHTHLQLDTGIYQTGDTWFEGSRAAAFGGITTVIDFATQMPGQSFDAALEIRLGEAASSTIDYAFHMMVTDLPPGQEEELGLLPELGVKSIKLYTTYRPIYYADDATILRLLEAAGRYGLMSLIHCENDALVVAQTAALVASGHTGWVFHGASRPPLAEQEAVARILLLAGAVDAPVVVAHASTGRSVELTVAARAAGQVAFSETAPQYLLLDSGRYEGNEPWRYILQPPLRPSGELEALWDLVSTDQVEMIVTDHCDYRRAQKLATDDFTKTPGGLPGTETSLLLMATYGVATGRVGWTDLVRMMAANPAQIYNLWPRKGALMPGSDADVVIFDPASEGVISAEELHGVSGYSPFEGMTVKGRVVSTLRRGEFLVRDGVFVAEPGSGLFLKREARYWD
jgi:dihydropyrimidinase